VIVDQAVYRDGRRRPCGDLSDELEGLRALVETGGGAGLQRRAAGDPADTQAVLDRLIECSLG